jgi:hypothetical protein
VRTAVAALLAALMVALAWAPHVHDGPHGDHECPACVARGAEPARSEVPDLGPQVTVVVEIPAAPVTPPPAGAPQGAVPGQSPPASA